MKKLKVCIDAGHGLETVGKRTETFTKGKYKGQFIKEFQFNKPTALFLKEEFEYNGWEVFMTMEGDRDVFLADRVKVANDNKADVNISIHFNYYKGWESCKGGISTHYYRTSSKSKRLAECVQEELMKGEITKEIKQQNRGAKASGLYVNHHTNMPSVLCELGFMDYYHEAVMMLDVKFQKEKARCICKGICKHFDVEYRDRRCIEKPEDNECNPLTNDPEKRLIKCEPTATKEQIIEWMKAKYLKIKHEIMLEIIDIIWNKCTERGINPVLEMAQFSVETGYLYKSGKSRADIDESFHNPTGVKTTSGGKDTDSNAHMRFPSWEIGIECSIQHLALYLGLDGYPLENPIDPRHFEWIKGRVKYVGDLGRNWTQSETYAPTLIKLMREIENTPIPQKPEESTKPTTAEKIVELLKEKKELENKVIEYKKIIIDVNEERKQLENKNKQLTNELTLAKAECEQKTIEIERIKEQNAQTKKSIRKLIEDFLTKLLSKLK